jgi:hypothetical protein
LSVLSEGKFALSIILAVMAFPLSERAARAADEGNVAAGLAVYSDMNFIEDEREYVGLQIALIPFNKDGKPTRYKVLWRAAGPFLNTPLLLDAVQKGKSLTVVVPDGNETSGTWTLTLKGNVYDAVGPGSLKYTLKKITVK